MTAGRTSQRSWRSGLRAGLLAALILGGLALLALGARGILREPPCDGLSPQECALEKEIAVHVGRRQTLVGGAFLLLALGLRTAAKNRG